MWNTLCTCEWWFWHAHVAAYVHVSACCRMRMAIPNADTAKGANMRQHALMPKYADTCICLVGERNRKARILVCSETYWMSSGCHILMFNWSFFSAEIFHWRYFVCFCSFARLHFRKFCIIWNRCREEASQYRHHQNFSPTSIHWIQKCECLLHEFEYQIMLSVSVFVSWNSSRKWNHYLNGYTVLLTVSAIKTRHY